MSSCYKCSCSCGVCDGPITTAEPGGRKPAGDTYYSFGECDEDCNLPF